ncbi:unnamed protein product [Orchesella dallaii]|uniref:Protein kinase domain-containing protein n=1 Tax=Orchesella dallaii TaxID=48710 RepID=A0ABP1RV09_9HEXA
MADLIDHTDFNTTLRVHLKTTDALSDDDSEQLKTMANARAQAESLYEILMKKLDGFKNLVEGLKKSKQSGALHILTKECINRQGIGLDDISSVTYNSNEILGRGSQKTVVYRGKFGSRDVAVNRKPISMFCEDAIQNISREINFLQQCDGHENIVRFFGSQLDVSLSSILIVLELCESTLTQWMTNRSIQLSHLEILKQITVGVEWIHSNKAVHMDLKPDNILIHPKLLKAKLSNFGKCHCVGDLISFKISLEPGKPIWIAPEIIKPIDNKQIECTFKSDVFALGCIFYYVLSDGKTNLNREDVKYSSADSVNIIEKMISNDPDTRPTCKCLVSCTALWSNWQESTPVVKYRKPPRKCTLLFKLTMYDIQMGQMQSDGNVKWIANSWGDISTSTLLGQTKENEFVYGLEAAENNKINEVVRRWTLYDVIKRQNIVKCPKFLSDGKHKEMSLDIFIGILRGALRIWAEEKTGLHFPKAVVVIPFYLDIEPYLREGAQVFARFQQVQIECEKICTRQTFYQYLNTHLSAVVQQVNKNKEQIQQILLANTADSGSKLTCNICKS